MTRALAYRILRSYPLAWRERYEAEVCALIEEGGVQFRDLAELLRGLLTERIRELLTSDELPKRTMRALILLPLGFSILLVAAAVVSGLALRPLLEPRPGFAAAIAVVLVIQVVVFSLRYHHSIPRPDKPIRELPAWAPFVLLPSLFAGIALITAFQYLGPLSGWTYWFIGAYWAIDVVSSFFPGRKLLMEFFALQGAERQVEVNRQLVADCEEWIGKGVPSPLADAKAQLEHWTRETETIQQRIHALGYRARFRHHLLKG